MSTITKESLRSGKTRPGADAGLIASTMILFSEQPTDNILTTEKYTFTIALGTQDVHADDLYLLATERVPNTESEAFYPGDLTIKSYNVIKVDGTKDRRVLHVTNTSSSANITQDRDYLIQGLFVGEGKVQIGCSYATDVNSTQKIYMKLYRL